MLPCSSNSCQMRIKCQNRLCDNRKFATQWSVHIQAAKVFPDLSEFGVDAVQARRDKVETPSSGAGETTLDVLHEFAPEIDWKQKGQFNQPKRGTTLY